MNEEIITRFNILTTGGENLEKIVNRNVSQMERLAAASRKASTEARLALEQSQNVPQGMFGKIFSPQMAQKSLFMSGLDKDFNEVFSKMGTSAGKGFAQNLIDEISQEPVSKMPTRAELLQGVSTELRESVSKTASLAKQLGMAAANGQNVATQISHVRQILAQTPTELAFFNRQLRQSIIHTQVMNISKTASLAKQLGMAAANGQNVATQISHVRQMLAQTPTELASFNRQLRQSIIHTKVMNRLGKTFSFLFGGMQLQRMGLSITRFLLPSMEQLDNHLSIGTKRVQGMRASFEFLKFSIFETFTQTPLFKKFVEVVIDASNWLSKMVEQYPIITEIAAVLGGIAVVLGTLSIGAGIFGLFSNILTYLGLNGKIAAAAAQTKTALKSLSFAKFVPVVLGGLAVWKTLEFLSDDGDFWDLLHASFFVGLLAKMLGAGVWSIPITLIFAFSVSLFKALKEAPRLLTKQEYGMSEKDWQEILAMGPDGDLHKAFEQGFQGSVVPSWARGVNDMASQFPLIESAANNAFITSPNSVLSNTQDYSEQGIVLIDNVKDRWESWTPSTKTVTIIERRVTQGGTSTGTPGRSLVGSITGG